MNKKSKLELFECILEKEMNGGDMCNMPLCVYIIHDIENVVYDQWQAIDVLYLEENN